MDSVFSRMKDNARKLDRGTSSTANIRLTPRHAIGGMIQTQITVTATDAHADGGQSPNGSSSIQSF
jgi:hypothetical protein